MTREWEHATTLIVLRGYLLSSKRGRVPCPLKLKLDLTWCGANSKTSSGLPVFLWLTAATLHEQLISLTAVLFSDPSAYHFNLRAEDPVNEASECTPVWTREMEISTPRPAATGHVSTQVAYACCSLFGLWPVHILHVHWGIFKSFFWILVLIINRHFKWNLQSSSVKFVMW